MEEFGYCDPTELFSKVRKDIFFFLKRKEVEGGLGTVRVFVFIASVDMCIVRTEMGSQIWRYGSCQI